MIRNSNAINSQQIMLKLNEIKKTFGESYNNQQNIQIFKNSEIKSKDNQKLQKYLPINRSQLRENEEIKRSFKEPKKISQQTNQAALTFRKTLEQRLENLFDQEKKLLQKRYEMNINNSNYSNQLLQSRNKNYYGGQYQNNQSDIRKANNSNIKDMENKIRSKKEQKQMCMNNKKQDRVEIKNYTQAKVMHNQNINQ